MTDTATGRGGGWRRLWDRTGAVVVVALGGALGSLLRYAAGLAWPTAPGTFPLTILTVNVSGCLVIGMFLVLITEVWTGHRLIRPFFATGVLGGFTTFSTYSLDVLTLVRGGDPLLALGYLLLTAVGALLAVTAGMFGVRRLVRWSAPGGQPQ